MAMAQRKANTSKIYFIRGNQNEKNICFYNDFGTHLRTFGLLVGKDRLV